VRKMNEEEIKMSFAAADVSFPAKLLHHQKLIKSVVEKHFIPPVHLQLNPTNKCDFNCSFCSCKNRNKRLQLKYGEILDVMKTAKRLGTESVTITGGGEPLLHAHINKIIKAIHSLGIQIGLVTNGTLFYRLKPKRLKELVWCRISASDELPEQLERIGLNTSMWFDEIRKTVSRTQIDWAFSYVVIEPNHELIEKIVEFANLHGFTHVRLVNNIFRAGELEKERSMDQIRRNLWKKSINDSIVNYQKRSKWERGTKNCYIALLKPVLGADGYWYPCCGTQYALKQPSYDYEPSMRLSEKKLSAGLREFIKKQEPFNGINCVKCYYMPYNNALRTMLSDIKHEAFI